MSLTTAIALAGFGAVIAFVGVVFGALATIGVIRALAETGWGPGGGPDDDVDEPDSDPEPAGEEPAQAVPAQEPAPADPIHPVDDPYARAREEVLVAIDSGDRGLLERVDACLNPLAHHQLDCACGPCRDRLLANWIDYHRRTLPAGGQA